MWGRDWIVGSDSLGIFCVLAWMEGKDLEKRIKDSHCGDFSRGLMGNYFFGLRRSGEGAMMPER